MQNICLAVMKMMMKQATAAIKAGKADIMDVIKMMKKIKMFKMFMAKMEKTTCFLKAIGWLSVDEETGEVIFCCSNSSFNCQEYLFT